MESSSYVNDQTEASVVADKVPEEDSAITERLKGGGTSSANKDADHIEELFVTENNKTEVPLVT